MKILNYLLFLCFIKLYNSFTFINKQFRPNFISRYYKSNLNMGCDYYIDKNLHIYDYNDKEISYINVDHEKGYYWFISLLDEDEDEYDVEFAQYKERQLKPIMRPITIYSNNSFNKISFENKYKQIIENDIKRFNKTLNDVNKIIKIENRYERW